jgi:hypothetical protein
VAGLRIGVHPSPKYDIKGAVYYSSADSEPELGAPADFFGLSGFSPVPAGNLDDVTWKVNLDLFEPFGAGPSFNFESSTSAPSTSR